MSRSTPPLAIVEQIRAVLCWMSWSGYRPVLPSVSSAEGDGGTLVSPDIAPCPACLQELADPADRRYRYPFINCTDCGPRFTIIRDLPLRPDQRRPWHNSPCVPTCNAEYEDIAIPAVIMPSRTAVPTAGRRYGCLDAEGRKIAGDVIAEAQKALARGSVLAVKGLGGIHLACDARNAEAGPPCSAGGSTARKSRWPSCAGISTAARSALPRGHGGGGCAFGKRTPLHCPVGKERLRRTLANLSDNRRLGVMLPYTPLHVLLLDGTSGGPDALVMTSANLLRPTGPVRKIRKPLMRSARALPTAFSCTTAPFQNRCDDSLVMAWQGREYFYRRSRGYVPQPVTFERRRDRCGRLWRGAEGLVCCGSWSNMHF